MNTRYHQSVLTHTHHERDLTIYRKLFKCSVYAPDFMSYFILESVLLTIASYLP